MKSALVLVPLFCLSASALAAQRKTGPTNRAKSGETAVPVAQTSSLLALNGPWRFHTGDDPRWADPNFDDSSWQSYELAPDVPNLTPARALQLPPLPGWQHYRHPRYAGYAWYRIQLTIEPGSRC